MFEASMLFWLLCIMYLVKTPWWLKKIYPPALTWNIPAEENEIYITFDDGPHPAITPFALDNLKQYNAKATFFCLGKNVQQYPDIYRQIIDEGHRPANHTHNHLNGWKVKDSEYFENISLAKKYIDSNLFRPPYGRISRFQIQQLKDIFKIVMWDVLSGDFDIKLSPQKCLNNVISNTTPGSVIVFHDSEKALPRLEYALPKALEFFAEKGFKMKVIK
jgi:peptidoglycan/xylan/chitin deacetylase (PgdA/CDA1 family)